MTKFRAAIIGLGQVGMGYDYDTSSPEVVSTHARAYAIHPNFEIVAGLDTDAAKSARFSRKYGARTFHSLAELMGEAKPDLVSLCTTTETHYALCKELLSYRPKAIICEKPICYSVSEAEDLLRLSSELKVPFLVNYMRRFEPGAQKAGELLRSGAIGPLQRGLVLYSKGLFNNASHFVDLLCFWLGEGELDGVIQRGRSFPRNDLEPEFSLSYRGARVSFLPLREECFSVAEVHLFGESGKLSYLEGGSRIELRKTRSDPDFPGYQILAESPELVPNELLRYQYFVMDELARFLQGEVTQLSCGLPEALSTLKLVDQVRQVSLNERSFA